MPTKTRYICIDNYKGMYGCAAIRHYCAAWKEVIPTGPNKLLRLMQMIIKHNNMRLEARYDVQPFPQATLHIYRENRMAIRRGESGYAFVLRQYTKLKSKEKKKKKPARLNPVVIPLRRTPPTLRNRLIEEA